jgi:hypothetical protein
MKKLFKNLELVNTDIKEFEKKHPLAYILIYICWYIGYVRIILKMMNKLIDYIVSPDDKKINDMAESVESIDSSYGEQ